jgi:nucleoside-diphosphate-sugar epimerase
MNILVTGASGFIGQRIIQRLAAKGASLTGSGLSQLKSQPKDYQYISADLTLYEACLQLMNGIDVVIHCAGKAGAWGLRAEFAETQPRGAEVSSAQGRCIGLFHDA